MLKKIIFGSFSIVLLLYLTYGERLTLKVLWLQDAISLFLGLVYEALPFLLLGIVISVVIELFVPTQKLLSKLPKNPLLRRLLLSLFGVLLPVCECGNVPTARALIRQGLHPADSLVFLLAAPILNPITITTTAIAFSFDSRIVILRVLGALLVSNGIGLLFSQKRVGSIITKKFETSCKHNHTDTQKVSEVYAGLRIFEREVSSLLPALFLGALIAATIQVAIPRDILIALGSDPVISVFAMTLLAFIISICANVDAFFALALSSVFNTGSIVAFLIFGPMVDIKILTMLRSTYTKQTLVYVTAFVALMSITIGMSVNYAI